MPIYLTLASLIIDKNAIEKKYNGGVNQFRLDYFSQQGGGSQEDDEVFMIARMNCDEYDLDELTKMGLEYNKETEYSNDFVIYQRYHGYLWQVDWIEDNAFYAWHINAKDELKSKANKFGNITMNELEKIYKIGQEAFIPLTKKNSNTHPIALLLNLTSDLKNDKQNNE